MTTRWYCLFPLMMLFGVSMAHAEERSWTDRVRLSGSAEVGFFGGGSDSVTSDEGFEIWDARFFIDAELGEDLELLGKPAIRNIGFTFEWNLVRNANTPNDVGLLYLDFEGIAESPWLNLRAGRFQIPFGEAYKLYSKGYAKRHFVHQPLGGPWWWDEGVLIHGTSTDGRFGYVASFTNGDNDFNSVGGGYQLTGKLWAQPATWLYVSGSGLWTKALKQVDGALWLGETWGRALGSGGPPLPNVVDGVAVPDDPNGLGSTWAVGLDAIVTPIAGLRFWLAAGRYDLESNTAGLYDRELWYWLAQATVGGQVFSPALSSFYAGFRVDSLGTADSDRGYLLDVRYTGSLGYNIEELRAYTAVLGWNLGKYVTMRAEYSHRKLDLVRGASAALGGRGDGNSDTYVIEFGAHF